MSARNNFQFQFLREADLRSVVAVEGDALENVEEIASKLLVTVLRNGIPVSSPSASALCGNGFVRGAKQGELLRVRSIDEILSERFVALFVDAGKTGEQIVGRVVDCPRSEESVN